MLEKIKTRLPILLLFSLLANAVVGSYLFRLLTFRSSSLSSSQSANQIRPTPSSFSKAENDQIFAQINPVNGYEINATFGNLGPKMLAVGVIDLTKFKDAYAKSGQDLPADLEKVLTSGSDIKIKITRENTYFMLNFFWALGLANKSSVLDTGEITKYGDKAALGNFASTGGWTLGKAEAMNYYSKSNLIPLTPKQEQLVNTIASNIYRPCCNNSTAFPDCNHGMALLAVLELMAQNGATENDLYTAGKYFNAFWFPGTYYDLAIYFRKNQKIDFADIDPKLLMSKDYSSVSGYQTIKKWLIDNGIQQTPPKSGGSCGV